jgi:hypothetical protein
MRVRSTAAALGLVLSLAACADGPREPSALPTLDPSAAATETASPDPTPTGINAPTPEGASAFARHWYRAVERAYRQKDVSELAALSTAECRACAAFIESIEQLKRDGGRVEGLVFEIRAAEARPLEGEAALIDVVYDAPETISFDADGQVDLREPAVQFAEESMRLVRLPEGSWAVAEITPS